MLFMSGCYERGLITGDAEVALPFAADVEEVLFGAGCSGGVAEGVVETGIAVEEIEADTFDIEVIGGDDDKFDDDALDELKFAACKMEREVFNIDDVSNDELSSTACVSEE
jgi:hypothetical protein